MRKQRDNATDRSGNASAATSSSRPRRRAKAAASGAADHRQLVHDLERRRATVGVVGLGYVGLPLVQAFCDGGFACIGVDVDPEKVEQLNAGQSYIQHIPSTFLRDAVRGKRFRASTEPADLRECGAIVICVPTPLTRHREPDMTYVRDTSKAIAGVLRVGQLVVLESTTYPGTTRDLVLPILESGGLKTERDFFLAYSPERQDPGRTDFTTRTTPKLVGGIGPRSLDVAAALYAGAVDNVVRVSSCEVAEAAKILENVYRCVNIATMNEMKMLLDRMGIDIWEVIAAAATKPFGFHPFYPGPGLGGHCIPIDPFYLTWKAREYGMTMRFIELAGEINTFMPRYVVERVAEALNARSKALKGARILVLGLAYKKDVADIRESPSIELIELFRRHGADVDYSDPHVPATPKQRHHDLGMRSRKLTTPMVRGYDCVVIATDHSAFDYPWIVRHARLIVDTRNATSQCTDGREKIVKA